jgi:adenylate cyclase class 2
VGETGNAGLANSYKIRKEREVIVADPATMAAILEGLGLRPIFRYEKYRSTYSLPTTGGLKVELDETPAGNFLELEGTPKAIDRAAALLGYRREDYITKSYGALWMERNGAASGGESRTGNRNRTAGDMLF